MAETMGTRIHVSDGLPAPREKVSHVLIDALCGAIPSMLYAIAIPLVATSASTVHVVELMAIVGVFVACLLNVASKTSTAFQAYRVPVLACVIATCIAGIVFIAPAREGAFAALNCTLSHANEEFNAYFGLLANGQTVATSPVFAVLAGVLAGILSWALSRVRISSVVLLAVVLYATFSMRLNMGMAAVGSSFAVTAWLLQCRFSQLRYSKLTTGYFTGLIVIILISNFAIMATVLAFYKPAPQISHASQSVERAVDDVRFGSDSLPQGNLAKAPAMNTGSDDCLAIHFEGVPSGDMLLRGFTGATFENGVWMALPESAFEGNWHGVVSWLAGNGLQPSFQRAAFDDARAAAGEGGTSAKTMRVAVHDASTRYVYAPANARSLDRGDVQANLDGTILSGMVGKDAYAVEYDDVAPSEMLADAAFLSKDETGYARAEAVFSAFSEEYYLDLSADDAEAVRTYVFNEETWDETAGESAYAVVSRVRTMLATVASYDEDPIDAPRGTSFAQWFFSNAREGNSAYFATIATMAFREQGIPARYVEGYRVGASELDMARDNNGDVLLGANQAHAWCEIYIQGIGWTPIEVTPGFYNQAIQPDNVVEVGEAYSSGAHDNVASDMAVAGDVDEEHGGNGQPRFSPLVLGISVVGVCVLAIVMLATVLFGQRQARRIYRKRRCSSENQSVCVPALYSYMAQVMAVGCPGFDKNRPLDCVQRFETAFPGIDSLEYQRVIGLYQAYTFGGRDLRPNELRTLRRFDERLHGALPKPENAFGAVVRYLGNVL